jgi:hypothetical protein
MGMFDNLQCDLPLPDGPEVPENVFQTKSFWRCLDQFTITAEGRLIFNERRSIPASKDNPASFVPIADIDMDYHGDIEFYGITKDHIVVSYAARFTHGTVEWIRPFEQLPELHRQWIRER